MADGEKSGKTRKSKKSRKSRKLKKARVKLADRDRIENEVHRLLPDNRKLVRSEAKQLFEEDETDCVTDRTPETPFNSDKELEEQGLAQNHKLDHNNLIAALNKVENNANVESTGETKGVQSAYEPIDNVRLETAIPLIPFTPPPTTNRPPLPQKFSLDAVHPPPHVMSVQASDSKSSLSSKTGDARSHSYTPSLGGSVSSTTSASSSSSSLHSQTGSIVPPSENGSLPSLSDVSLVSKTGAHSSISDISLKSQTGIPSSPSSLENGSLPSLSDVSLVSKTGPQSSNSNISLKSETGILSSPSNVSLKSETGLNATGIRTTDDRTDSSTDRSEKVVAIGAPSPSVSSSSLVSQTFPPMSSSSASLVSHTMSPMKEATMQETTDKGKSPLVLVPIIPSQPPAPSTSATSISTVSLTGPTSPSIASQTGASIPSINIKMPVDGHTSSIRSPREKMESSPDTRKDIHPSSQTPVREKPQDFSHRSNTSTKDSGLYQPSGRYNSRGEFLPGDQTLDDIPDIPEEKSDQTGPDSPPLRTATESVSSTSLCLTSSVVPDKIYGDPEDEIGAKSDKQFVGKLALKKNKKNEAGLEFEPSESKGRSKPRTPRKLKVTNVFGGADRKYVPPVRIAKPPTPAICARFPPLPDDSRAQLTTVTTVNDVSRAVRSTVTDRDLAAAPSLPLSVTKKSDRVVPASDPSVPTNVSLLRTETSLLSSFPHSPTPTTSPSVKSPVPGKKEKKKGVEKEERPLLSPLATSPVPPKRKCRKRPEKGRSANSRKSGHSTTPKERVIYRDTPVLPTLGTPTRQFRKKKGDKEDQSKKERERTKKSDQKKSNARATRDASDQTNVPIYQQLVYSSYVTNGLNVACYNYDEQEVQRKKPVS